MASPEESLVADLSLAFNPFIFCESINSRKARPSSSKEMSARREQFNPSLERKINSANAPGLSWFNKENNQFRVPWKRAYKPDAMFFKLWVEHTGKYLPGEFVDASTWKTRFRCILRTRRTSDVEELIKFHSLEEKKPYRVYRFKDKGKVKRCEE